MRVVDEAWLLKNTDSTKIVDHTTTILKNGKTRETFVIEMGHRIGYEGGIAGASKGFPETSKLMIIVEDGINLITSYPIAL